MGAVIAATAPTASAQTQTQLTIRNPTPPRYSVEIEPKLNLAPDAVWAYGGTGIGPGVRFSIPLVSPGFIPNLNNSVAITFGLDLVSYSGYAYTGRCDARGCYRYDAGSFWSAYFPVAMQWNFWLTERWSVFAEPGLAFRHAFINDTYCDPAFYSCGRRDDLYLAFFAGGRFKFSDTVGLTMRLGHPLLLSGGLSIFL